MKPGGGVASRVGTETKTGGGVGVDCDEDENGAGTRTGVETNERAQDGNGDGSGNGEGTGTGTGTGVETRARTQDGDGDGNERSSEDGNGDVAGNGVGNEDGIGEGGVKAEKCKKPHNKSCRRVVGNGVDLGGKRINMARKRVRSVATDQDSLENSKQAGRGAQGTQGLSKNCTSRESMAPLSRLIRGFRSKYHRSHLGGSVRVA